MADADLPQLRALLAVVARPAPDAGPAAPTLDGPAEVCAADDTEHADRAGLA